jgi:hypothetical protein
VRVKRTPVQLARVEVTVIASVRHEHALPNNRNIQWVLELPITIALAAEHAHERAVYVEYRNPMIAEFCNEQQTIRHCQTNHMDHPVVLGPSLSHSRSSVKTPRSAQTLTLCC